MKIAYVNRTRWLSHMPGTIFSTMNAYGFAQNGMDTTLVIRNARDNTDTSFESYFGLPKLSNFHIRTISDNMLLGRSNAIFYFRVYQWLLHTVPKYELIITRDPSFLPYLLKLKSKTKAKIFYQSHNFYFDTALQPAQTKTNQNKYHTLEKRCIPHLDGLLTLNTPQKELYARYVDIPIFAGKPGLKEYHPPQDNFDNQTILYTGSFRHYKGVNYTLEAFANMKNQRAKLILAGGRDDAEIKPVMAHAQKLGVSNRVQITGWLSYVELEKLITAATVGVIPLKNTFYNQYLTAPSKLFDYLAYAVPVVASDLPAIRDFITHDKDAILIPPDNTDALATALDAILSNHELYLKLMNNTHKTAKYYTWKDCCARMLEFMDSVV